MIRQRRKVGVSSLSVMDRRDEGNYCSVDGVQKVEDNRFKGEVVKDKKKESKSQHRK